MEPTSEGLTLAYDYNQLYVLDAVHELSPDRNDYSTRSTRRREQA